ncbi:MAG: hypothetical protein R3C56_40480 [Pirellulaceae bacterium]
MDLEAALQQATASKTVVEELDAQRTEATGQLAAMRATQEKHEYLNAIEGVRTAIAEKRWSDAQELLASTDQRYRGIEYSMLNNLASNEIQQPICVVIGRRSLTDLDVVGGVFRDSNQWNEALGRRVHQLKIGEQSRLVQQVFQRSGHKQLTLYDNENHRNILDVTWEYESISMLGMLDSGDLLFKGRNKKSSEAEVVVAAFAPRRYRVNSESLSNEEWEALTKQLLPFVKRPAVAKPNRQWLFARRGNIKSNYQRNLGRSRSATTESRSS